MGKKSASRQRQADYERFVESLPGGGEAFNQYLETFSEQERERARQRYGDDFEGYAKWIHHYGKNRFNVQQQSRSGAQPDAFDAALAGMRMGSTLLGGSRRSAFAEARGAVATPMAGPTATVAPRQSLFSQRRRRIGGA